jgi:hypothetical protein
MAEVKIIPEKVNWDMIDDFQGFNHDKNKAHSSSPHAKVIALAMLSEAARRTGTDLDTLEDSVGKILNGGKGGEGFAVSPGMLHLGMLEHHIPQNMVIGSIKTKRFADPLYVPLSGEDVVVKITKSEEPLVVEGAETHGVIYTFHMSGPNLHGSYLPLFGRDGVRIVAFPGDIDPSGIVSSYGGKFEEMRKAARNPIDSAGKKTNITEESDGYFWSSVRPSSLPREAELPAPIRRGGKISQIEMLAKLPRVLSLYRKKIETKMPPHMKPVEPTAIYFEYAELEKSHGMVEDIGKRARMLANQMMFVYAGQDAVFDPWLECPLDEDFTLTTSLIRQKRGMHMFVSQMVVGGGTIFVDTSKFYGVPVIPEAVMNLVYGRKLDVNSMKPF